MNRVARAAVAALCLFAAGCVTEREMARRAVETPNPDMFRGALQTEFTALAAREIERYDFPDARGYLDQADIAASGAEVRPRPIYLFDIPPERVPEARPPLFQLKTLYDGGLARSPKSLARAHAMYECILEELEEAHQADDIAWCKAEFAKAVAMTRRDAGLDADWGFLIEGEGGHIGQIALEDADGGGQVLDSAGDASFVHEDGDARDAALTMREHEKLANAATAMLPEAPKVFVVYFASGSASVDAEAAQIIEAAAADANGRPAPDVELLGFADRAGQAQRNLQLAGARNRAVAESLRTTLTPGRYFLIQKVLGEVSPAVETPDGVAEARNRRVEITVR